MVAQVAQVRGTQKKVETQGAQPQHKKPFAKDKFLKLRKLRKNLRWLDISFVSPYKCSLFYDEIEHEKSGEKIYKAKGCQDRATCPICGASYWKKKKREAKSLFDSQRDALMLSGSNPEQYLLDFEFTIPVALSRMVDDMPENDNRKDRRKYLNKLSRACYQVLYEVLGQDIGGVAVLHFSHSRNPLYPHYHLHIMVSPYKSNGELVLQEPHLPKEKLGELKERWRRKVNELFFIDIKHSLNVHYEYIKEGKGAINKYNHRFNYCFRHWTEDLLKVKKNYKKKSYYPAIDRAKELQKISKIRWFGYLTPSKRGKFGFQKIEFKESLLFCEHCQEHFTIEDLVYELTLNGTDGYKCPVCGEEREKMKKKNAWGKTGREFVLREFREEGALMERRENKKNTGEKVVIPYEKLSIFPNKGAKKRFVCRAPG